MNLRRGDMLFRLDSPVDALHAILTKQPAALSSVNPSMPSALGSLILAMLVLRFDLEKRQQRLQALLIHEDQIADRVDRFAVATNHPKKCLGLNVRSDGA
jgi:hypothetical protein